LLAGLTRATGSWQEARIIGRGHGTI
jgi:hypothetical protein